MTFRNRLYRTLTPNEKGGIVEQIFEFLLIIIILLNIFSIVMDSVHEIHEAYSEIFLQFEHFSVVFFSIEYIARIYSIVENPKYSHPIKGRIKYIFSVLAIIDLLAFLPFYLAMSLPIDFRFLRIFRLMALFRMFKIARYLHALNIFKKVLYDRKEQLVLSFFFILFVLVMISVVMFYTEHEAQPQVFSSIPATMWWGIATITTVGYGDIVPMTPLGKFLGGFFAIAGIGLLALPAGILSSGFFEMMHDQRDEIETLLPKTMFVRIAAKKYMKNLMMTSASINGLILAGGKSSRMGKDKSLISFHGKPQYEFLYTLLTSFCKSVFLSRKNDQPVPSNLNSITDRYMIESPLNGILSALDHDATLAWLTIAVDMPMIDAKTISYLIQNRDVNKMATCFFDSEGVNPEPLFTLWEPSCYTSLKDFLAKGNVSPRSYLKQSEIKLIPIPDQRALTNINSEEELKKFIAENKGNSQSTRLN